MWEFLAGLGIFLLGMIMIEGALSMLAGRPFKKFLRKHTHRPIKAILSGTIVTAILQSSSVVSLMVLALAGAAKELLLEGTRAGDFDVLPEVT